MEFMKNGFEFAGEIITRESEHYETSRWIWNRAIDVRPKALLYCKNIVDVCTAINYVRYSNDTCRITTGGHSNLGFCTGDDTIVINVGRINECEYNEESHLLYTGCGQTSYSVCKTLLKHKCFYPGPDASSCIGTWAMCGGIGCGSRIFGLGCDHLIQAEMVDYRGEIVIANYYQNQDLFWALRGAGAGNFGVVTGLTYALPPIEISTCYFELYIPICTRSIMVEFLEVWIHWLEEGEFRMNSQITLCNTFHEGKYLHAFGISCLAVEETKRKLRCFEAVRGLRIVCESRNYCGILESRHFFRAPCVKQCCLGRFCHECLERREIEALVDIIWGRRAEGSILSSLTFTGMGGMISNYSNQATSFCYRDAKFLITLRTEWFDNECYSENLFWMLQKYECIKCFTRGGYIYQPYKNYENYETEYYGENVEWLKQVKAKYDPYSFFQFPQCLKI